MNINFRDRLSRVKPNERLVDLAESRLVQKIGEGDITAIIFTLKTKGRLRGWTERNEQTLSPVEMDKKLAAEKAVQADELWLTDNPKAGADERDCG